MYAPGGLADVVICCVQGVII